jgi:hypothetical protein
MPFFMLTSSGAYLLVHLHTLLAQWSPAESLGVVETLRDARRLARTTAVQIEERILHQVDGTGGRWVGLPPVEAAPALDLAATIEQYWR